MARLDVNRSGEMEVFVRVFELGGFSAAARALRMTPSAISKLVGRLETRLGARLVNRSTRTLQFTPEGRLFYDRSVRLLADMEEVERSVAEAVDEELPSAENLEERLILIVEEGDFGPLAHVEVPTAAPCGLQTLVDMVEVRGRGGVAVADRVTHAEGPAVMLSQGLRDGIASLQRYGLGHATFNNR